jgi:hypothetical protein
METIMKKTLLLFLAAGMALTLCAQRREVETEFLKNKIDAGASFSYSSDNSEPQISSTGFTIPHAVYFLETVQEGKNKFTLTADMGYGMEKIVYDGKAEEGKDTYEKIFYLDIDPELKFVLSDKKEDKSAGRQTQKNANSFWDQGSLGETEEKDNMIPWFATVGLPLYYANVTPQEENSKSYNEMTVDLTIKGGYDKKKTDIKYLSPWAKFESGLRACALIDYRITETIDDEEYDKLPFYLGMSAEYARDLKGSLRNAMAKGFFSLRYQMQEESVRSTRYSYAGGYEGIYTEINYGIKYAHDLSKEFNICATAGGMTLQLDDENGNRINTLNIDLEANYYPTPLFRISGGMEIDSHLREDDSQTNMTFSFGAYYTFDILNQKAKTEEPADFYDF